MAIEVVSGETLSGATLANDQMYVYAGGSALVTTVNYQGEVYVSSGGVADSTTVNSSGYLTVYSGGTANSTALTKKASLTVSGGTVNETTTDGNCWIYVREGGTANETTVNSAGYLHASNGGTANGVTVNSDGKLWIRPGGVANDIVVYEGGSTVVSSGGVATAIKENGGIVYVSSGGNATFVANNISGLVLDVRGATLHSGTTATETTVNSYGRLYIFAGGEANSTFLSGANYGSGEVFVYSGGVANSTLVNTYGCLYAHSGGVANETTMSGGAVHVSGGTANSTLVSGYGNILLFDGGVASETVLSYGSMVVSSGAVANDVFVDYGGRLYVRGTANDVRTDESGSMWIYSGGVMNNVVLSGLPSYPYWGTLNVSSGGTANNVWLKYGGHINVSNGGVATIVFDPWRAGTINVSSGGTVTYLESDAKVYYGSGGTISKGDYFSGLVVGENYGVFVYSGGSVDATSVGYWGSAIVSNGGVANGTLLGAEGWYYGQMDVFSGGTANSTTVNAHNYMYVYSGGEANSTVVNSSGVVHISGGEANDTIMSSGAIMAVSSGGTVNRVTIADRASVYVSAGGSANDVTVDPGADFWVDYASGSATAIRENGGYVRGNAENLTFVSNTFSGLILGDGVGSVISEGGWYTQATVHSGTTAVSTTVNNWAAGLSVCGGLALDTLVNSGRMEVYSGGYASGATANSSGSIRVYSGGEVADVTVNSSGYLGVYNGAVANSVRVTYYGRANVSSAGTANDVMLGAYGSLTVCDGGTATIAYNPFGGGVVYSSAGATVTYLERDAKVYYGNWSSGVIGKADVFDNLTLSDYLNAYVFSGGVMNSTTLETGGGLQVSSGGAVNATVVNSGGWIDVYAFGSASGVTVNMGCYLWVDDDGTATAITENGGGVWLNDDANATFVANTFGDLVLDDVGATVHSGTTANAITLKHYGSMYVFSGGIASATVVSSAGELEVSNGGLASATTVYSSGYLTVYSGGTANSVTVNSGGHVYVNKTGSVTDLAMHGGQNWYDSTYAYIFSGGVVDRATVNSGASLYFSSGASGTQITENGGYVRIEGGADVTFAANAINGLTLTWDATLHSGTTASNTTVGSGGDLYVEGGTADATTVSGGEVQLYGGTANRTTLSSGGGMAVCGGEANEVTMNSDSILVMYGNGTVNSAVMSGGTMAVALGGTANSTTIYAGGSMHIMSGGKLTGRVEVAAGAFVSAYEGSVIDFDVSTVAPGGAALYNDYSLITGAADAAHTITVSTTQLSGVYALADNAAGFDKVITVNTDEGTELGTITVGGELVSGRTTFQLAGSATGTLALTVIAPPAMPTVSASVTTPTNRDVTLTATFSADSVTKQYSFDKTAWSAYTTGVTVAENKTVYFRAGNAAGFSDVAEFAVANIDKAPPAKPTVTADITAPTNQSVTVTATFPDDSAVKEYSYDNAAWQNYTTGIVLTDNGTVYFRATDAAGNVSDVAELTVSNIDKVAPAAPTATADVTTPTNQSVTVTAEFGEDAAIREYSYDNATWKNYTAGIVMTDNGTVFFRATDAAGNVSDVAEFTVANIDKVAPDAPTATANITTPTQRAVTVTATFPDDSAVKEYSLDNATWQPYTEGVVLSANGTVYFRATDAAGNVSEVAGYEVTNITVDPGEKIVVDITTPTNRDVTVTATFSDDSVTREYSTDDGETWQPYTGGVVMKENGTVRFRGTDATGAVVEVMSRDITNIDKIPPAKPTAVNSTTDPTNRDVTVRAEFAADSVEKEYSLDGETWQPYTDGVVMKENGTVYFRSTDAVGNVSDVTTCEVANIDREPPAKPTSATENITGPTNTDVTVTAKFSADSVTKEYSTDNKTWKPYGDGVTVSENGTIFFRGIDAAGNVSEVMSYEVTNIDKTAPVKPPVAADITKKTGKDVRVTATFPDDCVKKEYSLDGKTWKSYPADGVSFAQNGTVYFRGADAAGNVSDTMRYDVTNIDNLRLAANKTTGTAKVDPMQEKVHATDLDCAGFYKLTGTFGKLKKGTVTVFDKNGKKVGTGKIKDGVLTFNKGRNTLLDSSMNCTVSVKHTDKKGAATEYTLRLNAVELFTKGDNTDDTNATAKTLAAGTPANDWVGYGDAVDYYRLGVDARGGFYDLSIAGVRNNVRLTIYAADGRKVKGVTVSAKKPAVALANLCLANGSYAVVEAPKAAKAQNSDYQLKLTEKAVFTGAKNNDWAQAEVLAKGATFTGALTTAVGGDVVDYCDVSKIDALTFDMTAGKTKVSFFDAQHNAVKTTVKLANGAEKTAASLTLAAGNAATDNFTIAAIDDAVKYLKIEAAGKTLNGYTITKIA